MPARFAPFGLSRKKSTPRGTQGNKNQRCAGFRARCRTGSQPRAVIMNSMKARYLFAIVAAGISAFHFQRAIAASELAERDAITEATKRSLLSDDFDALESASVAYRREKSRTPSGLWKLTVFYAGIDEAIGQCTKGRDPAIAFLPFEEKTKKWVEAYPASPTAYIAQSMVLSLRAWAYRGCGYADTVTEEGWVGFRQYISAARTILEEHKAIAAVDPQWYDEMLIIAKAQGWELAPFNELLDEALDREPQFYQTYFSALEYLLPKWGGSAEEIEDFAQDAATRTQDREGQGMYARLYWFASQTQFKNDIFNNSLVNWSQMKAGFDDVIRRYPDAWNLNNYARFACLARDKPKTIELLKRIEASVVPEAWVPLSLKQECAHWAAQP